MKIDFNKGAGLIPAIIQDDVTQQVLMLGYMNEASYQQTLASGKVTFFSRSRQEIWVKGATSGNYLHVVRITTDCDSDSLLISVQPEGPVCHTGSASCFSNILNKGFLYRLEQIIQDRVLSGATDSYTRNLYSQGMAKMAQKVGEEAVELVIEALSNNPVQFDNEAADLTFHFLLLLRANGRTLADVESTLLSRHQTAAGQSKRRP
jgi:phosphoribosyl-ATP pyrophosphohydrolase/phosphoribosyl-AMP cyclohydrolase